MKLFRCAWITISWPSCLGIAQTQAADRARIMLKKGENFTFSIKINQLQVLSLRQRFESCWSLNFSSSSFCYFFNRPFLNYFWPFFQNKAWCFDLHENEFNLHVNEKLLWYERMSTYTRFEKEPKDNLEMGYCSLSTRIMPSFEVIHRSNI